MSNAVSFNLLKFVEHRPVLSAGKIMSIIFLCAVILLGYFLFQVYRVDDSAETATQAELTIHQLTQTLQPFLQQGMGNPLVGVLSSGSPQEAQGFYPEFEALTHIQVKGLWLQEVVIQRRPTFIKISGAMDDPDKLQQLLKQLALQPAFKNIRFLGVDVSKGLLPDVPKEYQEEVKQLKLPVFYHFTLQTTSLKQSMLQTSEVAP